MILIKANSFFLDPKKDAFGLGIFEIGHFAAKWEFFLLQMIQSRSALQFSLMWPLLLQRKQKGRFFFRAPCSVCCCWAPRSAPCWLDSALSRPTVTGTNCCWCCGPAWPSSCWKERSPTTRRDWVWNPSWPRPDCWDCDPFGPRPCCCVCSPQPWPDWVWNPRPCCWSTSRPEPVYGWTQGNNK